MRFQCISRRRCANSCRSSDADSDVLADYVLALVRAEDPDEQVKSNCLENLEDFLHDGNSTSGNGERNSLTR